MGEQLVRMVMQPFRQPICGSVLPANRGAMALRLVLATLTVLCGAGCQSGADSSAPPAAWPAPATTGDGWATAAPRAKGVDDRLLSEMHRTIRQQADAGISSVLLAHDGALIFEAYYGEWNREALYNTSSAAKPLTSALVGIAIDQGFIPSVDRPVLSYFPEYDGEVGAWDARKSQITLAHVLSMSSGMRCDEDAMYPTDDWIKFFFDQPLVAAPGERFSYNTCGVVALGNVITKASGLRIPEFANRDLFGPMQISAFKWPITNSRGSQGLAMTAG